MSDRDSKIRAEAQSLWAAVRGGPAPQLGGSDLLDLIVRGANVADYDRLYSPHLRPGTMTGGRPGR